MRPVRKYAGNYPHRNSAQIIFIPATAPTGWVDVDISQDGLPRYIIHENVAWDFISLSSQAKDVAPQCDAVCFGSLAQRNPVSRQTILDFP